MQTVLQNSNGLYRCPKCGAAQSLCKLFSSGSCKCQFCGERFLYQKSKKTSNFVKKNRNHGKSN